MPDDPTAHLRVREDALGLSLSTGRVSLGGWLLFDDLRLDLAPGRWLCLLGPSGIGKSSLLRLIAGLIPPGEGTRIRCSDGGVPQGRVALMAQQDLLLPWLSVLDNVLLGARYRGRRVTQAMRDAARDLLARAGLHGREDARPDTLSGGQRQRVALVRTLIEDRPLVLMDEPFAAVDAITRWRLQDLAAEWLTGRTVLHVTHDPQEALRLGDTVQVMTGMPPRLSAPIAVPGRAPRAIDAPDLLGLQRRILETLAGEMGTNAC